MAYDVKRGTVYDEDKIRPSYILLVTDNDNVTTSVWCRENAFVAGKLEFSCNSCLSKVQAVMTSCVHCKAARQAVKTGKVVL